MRALSIDIETFSGTDIKKAGMYKYAEDPDFAILLFAYAFDDEPVTVIDLVQWESVPVEVVDALTDADIKKMAWNAQFERVCIGKHLGVELPRDQWECTMVKAAMLGLPMALDQAAKVLHLSEKLSTGKMLINYFTKPCKPTKANGQRTRNYPEHDLDKWAEFKRYNQQDVVVEREIRKRLDFFTIPEQEQRLYALDQLINDTGVLLDMQFINNAISIDSAYRARLTAEAVEITGLQNPNSVNQLKDWLTEEMPLSAVEGLKKSDIPILITEADGYENSDTVKRVLNIRQEISKSSVKKYYTMTSMIGSGDRYRGMLQFCGAGRTWRWAGRGVQVHNLPRIALKDLDLARQLVLNNDGDMLELCFGNVPDTLSQLIRTAFVAPEGSRLIPCDFSAIEARVIAWLSGERWRLEVFRTHGKIYEASAAQMFKVPIESISYNDPVTGKKVEGPNYPLRQRGKVAELALGFQGGPDALITMGALAMGINEDELPKLVRMWRNANPAICKFWYKVNDAAIEAVKSGKRVTIQYGISFFVQKDILFIQLPSGRRLAYVRPKISQGEYGDKLSYEGVDQTKKIWRVIPTYGGKLVENIVQAVARDCLADAMFRLHAAGYKIAFHVHDEVVIEAPYGFGSCEEINQIMCQKSAWAAGLPLNAESYETHYYKKD